MKVEDIVKAIKQIPGFKLSKSHFLIGSKIHLEDFYFAKRLFQNSFFASKFAFLITKHIIETHQDIFDKYIEIFAKNNKFEPKDGITLLGYGLYSELLVSLVEYFLKKKYGTLTNIINHNIVDDVEEVKLIKGYEKPKKYVILIVPISSTFSTSIKIEETYGKDSEILSPHISIILVSDGTLTNSVTTLSQKFGWEKIDTKSRIIKVNAFYENTDNKDKHAEENKNPKENAVLNDKYVEEMTHTNADKVVENKSTLQVSKTKSQKYFLALPSKWYDINKCELCFPQNPLEEISLHFTDKTSVTPSLIYDIPRGRIIEKENLRREFSIKPEALAYQHLKRDGTHYSYYISLLSNYKLNKDN